MKRRAQPWLGTLVEISIADGCADAPLQRAFAAAFAQIASVHRLMSFHDEQSDLTRINRAAVGSVVTVDAQTVQVLTVALQLSRASDAAFNINCASRLVRWQLLPPVAHENPAYPADASALQIVDATHVRKTGPALFDLGGIAKGYAVDQAIQALQHAGIESACVNAGGDLRVLGKQAFAVTIRHPQAVTQAGAQIELTDTALATSATYFSRRSVRGEQVSALIDGRSGAAILSERSVSVTAPSCMLADALTKVVLVSGDAQHRLLAHYDASALII